MDGILQYESRRSIKDALRIVATAAGQMMGLVYLCLLFSFKVILIDTQSGEEFQQHLVNHLEWKIQI